ERDLASVGQELTGRSTLEQEGRDRLLAQRAAVRELEEDLQRRAEAVRALEGERAALERERAELGQQLADASQERARRAETEWAATSQVGTRAQEAAALARAAGLEEQLLGEWLHAVLVRDANAVETIRRWHEEVQPGPLVLLPSVPGPRLAADGNPLNDDLRVDGPAAAWVRALLAGNEVLDGGEAGR